MLVAARLTAENLSGIRRRLRDALRSRTVDVRMQHVGEAVASGFRMRTEAALLAAIRESGGSMQDVSFSRTRFVARICELSGAGRDAVSEAADAGLRELRAEKSLTDGPESSSLPSLDWSRKERMISLSKTAYRLSNPHSLAVFDAVVCTRSRGVFWYGDLDVTRDAEALRDLASDLGEPIFVLRSKAVEMSEPITDEVLAEADAVATADRILEFRDSYYSEQRLEWRARILGMLSALPDAGANRPDA